MIGLLIIHGLCALAGIWIARKAKLDRADLIGGLVGGLLNILGLAVLGGIWAYRRYFGDMK